MLDKARAHRRQRGPLSKKEEIPLLDLTVIGDFFRSAQEKLPEISEKLQPYIRKAEPYVSKGKEKIEDAYAAVAQVVAEQKEVLEDYLAARKERKRSETKN